MMVDSVVLSRPTYVAGRIVTQVDADGGVVLRLDHGLGVLRVTHAAGEDLIPLTAIAVMRVHCVVDPGAVDDVLRAIDSVGGVGGVDAVDAVGGVDAVAAVDAAPCVDDVYACVDDSYEVLRAVEARPRANAQRYAADLGWDVPRVSRALRALVTRGRVDCAGRTRGRVYWLAP